MQEEEADRLGPLAGLDIVPDYRKQNAGSAREPVFMLKT
jgi:hypothetical protein